MGCLVRLEPQEKRNLFNRSNVISTLQKSRLAAFSFTTENNKKNLYKKNEREKRNNANSERVKPKAVIKLSIFVPLSFSL